MENHNNIDKLFSDESEKAEENTDFPAFEKVWEKVEQRLNQKDKRRMPISMWLPYGIAASLAIIFGSLYFLQLNHEKSDNKNLVVETTSDISQKIQTHTIQSKPLDAEKVKEINSQVQQNIIKSKFNSENTIVYQNSKPISVKNILEENSKIYKTALPSPQAVVAEPPVYQSAAVVSNVKDFAEKSNVTQEVVIASPARKRNTNSAETEVFSVGDISSKKDSLQNGDYIAGNLAEYSDDDFKISMEKGSEPLFIIDGYIANDDFLKTYNPKRIYSVNIVEGRSAEKFYGKSGEKGVVLITTKGLTKKEEAKLQKISKNYNYSGKVN